MPSAYRNPPPRLGRVAWPPDRGLRTTLVLSLVAHALLVLFFFFFPHSWMPGHPPQPVYRVEILGLPEPVPVVLPEPEPAVVAPTPPPKVADVPPPVPVELPPPTVAPAPPPVPPSAPAPLRELPPPREVAPRLAPRTAPAPALPESQTVPVRTTHDVDLGGPNISKPVVATPRSTAPQLANDSLVVTRDRDDQLQAPSVARTYASRSSASSATLPDQTASVPVSSAHSSDIAVPRGVRSPTTSERRNIETALPTEAPAALPVATRSGPQLASPSASVRSVQQPRAAVPVDVPQERAFAPPVSRAPTVAVPTSSSAPVPPSKTYASPVQQANVPLRDEAPGVSGRSSVQIDQTSLAYFRGLRTCLNTEEEMQLKTILATRLEQDKSCTAAGSTIFYFINPVDAYSLRVGVKPGPGVNFRDRCEALRAAVRCVEHN